MGNYKSFGDTKIVPGIPKVSTSSSSGTSLSNGREFFQEKFGVIVESSELEAELLERLWRSCEHALYSLDPKERQLGLGEEVGMEHPVTVHATPSTVDSPLVHRTLVQ